MKWTLYLSFAFLFCFFSCKDWKREQELTKKEAGLNLKERQLNEKERLLQLKEEELSKLKLRLDSTLNKVPKDSGTYNPNLVGTWSVTMICTETTCPGSAVGDTKTEQWTVFYENNKVIAKAFDNGKLARIYTGLYTGSTLELAVKQQLAVPAHTTIIVRLQQSGNNKLEGTREITREENCKILYAVQCVKQ